MTIAAGKPLTPQIEQILEVLLAPGHKARLSPFVESALVFTLTGEWPEERERYQSTQAILKRHKELIEKLASTWLSTQNQFIPQNYQKIDYLQMYAAYYFSVNVCKLQTLLFDLARQGKLDKEIHVVDIGVGTGSTAIATLDFLYAWGLVCGLRGEELPIEKLTISCFDKSGPALDFAQKMTSAYGEALFRRLSIVQKTSEPSSIARLLKNVTTWSQKVTWEQVDLVDQLPLADSQTNLVVLSNVLNELDHPDAQNHIEEFLQGLRDGSFAVIIEPGDKENATRLMGWRQKFIAQSPSFSSIAPCGDHLVSEGDGSCADCWIVRRESFHEHLLYQEFRSACERKMGKASSFDDYENNDLKWSYAILKKDANQAFLPAKQKQTLKPGVPLVGDGPLRALGKFYRKSDKDGFSPVDYPVDEGQIEQEERQWTELIKICPSLFSDTRFLVLQREPGYQIPRLRFGQEFHANFLDVDLFNHQPNCFKLIPLDDGKTSITPFDPCIANYDMELKGFLAEYNVQTRLVMDEIAYRLFGFPAMRSFQHDILNRVMCGKNVLGIAATGGGKSECYILPSMILPGVTIVVSPLRSLMDDQYNQRISRRYGLGDLSTFINGDVPFRERQARLKRMELGYYKLVYFTPEQLERGYILDSLRRTNQAIGIRYLAMDEAHCISLWGHDFRPSYLNIIHRLREYGIMPSIIALTATASPRVRDDICNELGLNSLPVDQGGDVYVYSSNRPEINFVVRVNHTTEEKISDILDELQDFKRQNENNQEPGAALVFLPHTGGNPENLWRYFPKTPKSKQGRYSAGVTGFASYLERKLRTRIAIYHGKMDNDSENPEDSTNSVSKIQKPLGDLTDRSRSGEQLAFIESVKTGVDIMVATKGFGMGIDKPNIRLVIHRSPTTNMEAYAQEAGRAGRDNKMATAILYYSPDSPVDGNEDDFHENGGRAFQQKVQSDHQIQEGFLSDKYIRREDVIVMQAFLKELKHSLPLLGENGLPARTYLYFTNDEALEYFDECQHNPSLAGLSAPYIWPKFVPRESTSYESEEHREILDRGHVYTNKTRYIDRILAAILRIRPMINGKSQSMLESVQETGARIKYNSYQSTCNWQKTIHSNAYFGEVLRNHKVTEAEFRQALVSEDLLEFARRINLTLKEVAGLFYDIKNAEGRFSNNRWLSSLLDFSYIIAPLWGPAAGKDDLTEWRRYAGAVRRSSHTSENAKKNRRTSPTLDDYFTWKEVSKSNGWEVLPGPAFDVSFHEFLDAFMQLHDTRKNNDWASYHRLLTDYIGVDSNGFIPTQPMKHECLRSVLLGYLESYEVVIDGNCYSCSQCVPDGNYGKYSLEQRQKAVTHMKPGLINLFRNLKESHDHLPENEVVDEFFNELAKEEAEGRALYRYFIGWSGKLLDDEPGHRTALWLRFLAMAQQIIPFQPQELLNMGRQLISESAESIIERIDVVLQDVDSQYENDITYFQLRSEIARRRNKPEDEVLWLQKMVGLLEQSNVPTDSMHNAAIRLAELHSPAGPISNQQVSKKWRLLAARTSRGYDEALKEYQIVISDLEWDQVLDELTSNNKVSMTVETTAGLLIAWLQNKTPREKEYLIDWFKENPESIPQWPATAQNRVIEIYPEEMILSSEQLVGIALQSRQDTENSLSLGLKYLSLGKKLPTQLMEKLAGMISSRPVPAAKTITLYITDNSSIKNVCQLLLPHCNFHEWEDYVRWANEFIEYDFKSDLEVEKIIGQVIAVASRAKNREQAIMTVQDKVLEYACENKKLQSLFIQYWLPTYVNSPGHFYKLAYYFFQKGMQGQTFSDLILDNITKNSPEILRELTSTLQPLRWKLAGQMVDRLEKFKTILKDNQDIQRIDYSTLRLLSDLFEWRKDQEEAEMLAAILMEIREYISPGYKSPIQLLTEVLVYSGHSQLATQLTQFDPDLFIRKDHKKISPKEFINSINIHQRTQPISSNYINIAQKLLTGF